MIKAKSHLLGMPWFNENQTMVNHQKDMNSGEFEYQCYVCGNGLAHVSRHLSDELAYSSISFEDKLGQIISQDNQNNRDTDVVCLSCWSLIENIAKQQNEVCTMIKEVNERLARPCQQNFAIKKSADCHENEPEDNITGPAPALSSAEDSPSSESSDEAEEADTAAAAAAVVDPPAPAAASCPDCPVRRFASAASLRRHRRKKHERHLGCPFCSRPVRESYLEMHILIKHSRTERGYLCTLCDRYYESAKYLKVHLRTVHGDGKQYQCTECGRLLANRGSLHAHMQRHARSLQCPLCSRRFALRTQLETHQRHHTGERPFLCTDCGKSFISAERMRKHAHVHASEPTCGTCGGVFASRAGLLAHQRTHSGERPFACAVCGKTFKRASHLNDHMSSVHGDSRPFKCGQCDRAFTLEPYLKRHERLHAGEKPHGCAVCGKSFAKKYNLQAHLKTHESAPAAAGAAQPPAGYPAVPAPLPLAPAVAPPALGSLAPPTGFAPPPPPPLQLHAGYVWA